MREIKFRAWDNELKIMVHDFDQDLDKHYPIEVGDSIHNLVWRVGLCYESLMQHTGIKDKNGVEIYEGDIIDWDAQEWGEAYIEVVEWDYELFNARENDWTEWCEVVGNIHENPELLEQVK